MGLPVRQQRTLEEIEGRLAGSDPHLKSLFSIFSRLCRGEAMPWFENVRIRPIADRFLPLRMWFRRIAGRPAKRIRLVLLLPAALSAMACATLIAFGFPGPRISHVAKPPAARELVVKSSLCRIGLLRVPAYC
ncbi:MAG TPA: hypothetical protein VIX86_27405 [Streptosporangiaceae bacterium]